MCRSDETTQPSNKLSRRTVQVLCCIVCLSFLYFTEFDFLYRFPPLVTSAALVDAKGEVRKEKAKEKELNKQIKRERSCKSANEAREVPIRTL